MAKNEVPDFEGKYVTIFNEKNGSGKNCIRYKLKKRGTGAGCGTIYDYKNFDSVIEFDDVLSIGTPALLEIAEFMKGLEEKKANRRG